MDIMDIASYIKSRLKEKGISQEKLAQMLNVSSSAVSQALSGKNLFDISKLTKLGQILDEPLDSILNAGKESETRLESLAKMPVEKFKELDPDLKTLREEDRKGNTLFDYVVKNKNVEMLEFLQPHGLHRKMKDNIRYMTLLIDNQDKKSLESVEGYLPRLGKGAGSHKHLEMPFEHLDKDVQEFVKALVHCENPEIHRILPYLDAYKRREDHKTTPAIVYHAIRFDAVHILRMEEKRLDFEDEQLIHIYQSKYRDLLEYAITTKSKKCIQFCYEKLRHFDFETYFNTLFETRDIDFIRWFKGNLAPKTDEYGSEKPTELFDNFKTIESLVQGNDYDTLAYAIEFSNQKSLDNALQIAKEDQIDIIKLLLQKGARITHKSSYNSGHNHVHEHLTGLLKHILEKIDKN